MKGSLVIAVLGFALAGWTATASAENYGDMVGKWSWEGFTIKVTKSDERGISAKVVEGPKNVGMEMIKSQPKNRADFFVAQVKHPANGKVYHTKISQDGQDIWRLDGCTDGGACASGVFERVE